MLNSPVVRADAKYCLVPPFFWVSVVFEGVEEIDRLIVALQHLAPTSTCRTWVWPEAQARRRRKSSFTLSHFSQAANVQLIEVKMSSVQGSG